jgi:hypothetical protein
VPKVELGTSEVVDGEELKIANKLSLRGCFLRLASWGGLLGRASDVIRAKATHPFPLKKLIEFERVRLDAGASTTVQIAVPVKRLALTNSDGDYELCALRWRPQTTPPSSRAETAKTSRCLSLSPRLAYTRTCTQPLSGALL